MPWSSSKTGPYLTFWVKTDSFGNGYFVTSPYREWSEDSYSSVQKRKRPAVLSAPSSQTNYNRSYVRINRGMFYAGSLGGRPIPLVADPSAMSLNFASTEQSARDIAASKLRMHLKDQVWNAATTFGELHKTLEFFVDTAKDLLATYRLARKGDLLGLSEFYRQYDMYGRRRKPPYKRVANRWLQWRYAVRPLAYDLEDILTEFYLSGARPVVSRTVGKGKDTYTKSTTWATGYTGLATRGERAIVEAKYVCTYTLEPSLTSWKRLGLLNVPALLWELTPGSFLFDWVLPIGTWLNGLDADVGVNAVSTTLAVKYDLFDSIYVNGGQSTSTGKVYSRAIGGIPSQPAPVWRTADYDLKNRMVDVLALLTQASTLKSATNLRL